MRGERVFTRQAVREVDRLAVERYGMSGLVLMENASKGLADSVLRMLREKRAGVGGAGGVVLVAGGGNNGGDAFAAARHLHNAGVDVTVVALKALDSYTGDAAANLNIIRNMNLPVIEGGNDPVNVLQSLGNFDIVVDGIFGTGLTTEVRGAAAAVINWINTRGIPVVAIDLPSGLDCDTGRPLGIAVRAQRTVTFVGIKKGFLSPESKQYTGEVEVVAIGVPRQLIEELSERP